jgi:hypothetical protein
MASILESILALQPDSKVTVKEDDVNKINWHDGNPNNITNQQILNKKAELDSQYINEEYKRNRAKAYPLFSEFIEAYTEKEILDKTDKWDAYVENYNKVRSDFPKP